MIFARSTIMAMAVALRRVKGPQARERLAPLIQRLDRIQPGVTLTIECQEHLAKGDTP